MFGYVYPFKPDLKIRYYNTFKSYYCSLCHEIKKNYGNIPRVSINFDTTFMAILLDSFSTVKHNIEKKTCLIHPVEKKFIIKNNPSINYASHITIILAHNKIIDDINDENNLFSKIIFPISNKYMQKLPREFDEIKEIIFKNLNNLKNLEMSNKKLSIDEFSHPFGTITKNIFNFYAKINNFNEKYLHYLENIGYNLGKWIYIIDAFNDIEKDFKNKSFNPIFNLDNSTVLSKNMDIIKFKKNIKDKFSSLLTYINSKCLENFEKLSIDKNYYLIENILQLGMPFKIDKIVNHFQCSKQKGSVINE